MDLRSYETECHTIACAHGDASMHTKLFTCLHRDWNLHSWSLGDIGPKGIPANACLTVDKHVIMHMHVCKVIA